MTEWDLKHCFDLTHAMTDSIPQDSQPCGITCLSGPDLAVVAGTIKGGF